MGFDNLPGECHVVAVSENGKINVNDPLFLDGERARNNVAAQLFSLTGGQLPESPYDILFTTEDETGTLDHAHRSRHRGHRLVGQRTFSARTSILAPVPPALAAPVRRDDSLYQLRDNPYRNKNAPFDSIEELRLIRGFSDDFWANFSSSRSPTTRRLVS